MKKSKYLSHNEIFLIKIQETVYNIKLKTHYSSIFSKIDWYA